MTILLRIIVLTVTLALTAEMKAQSAVQYMDKISKEFSKISEETWDYTRAVAHNKKAKLIENKRRDMLNANRNGLNRIKNLPAYKGDASYRDSVVRYLELSYAVLNYDYSKIVDMEEISEQSYDAMEAYMTAQEKANEKLDAASDMAEQAQRDFAEKNNIRLVDNDDKTEQKLEKASEVFKFYNKVFLIFFKPYKQEGYLLDAQSKGDINAMKQNQEALSDLSKKAKESLKPLKPYKNNTTLKATCSDLMDFFIYEADKKVPQLVDFYLKKEKFDKLKAAMDKKGQNKATASDINEFNAAVNDFNKASSDFNAVNEALNKKRVVCLDNWNNAVSRFLDKNVSVKK